MNLRQALIAFLSRKDSQARITSSINQVGQAVSSPANYESFAKNGYQKNAVVYKCISMIAGGGAGIKWNLYQKRVGGKPMEIDDQNNPLLKLWNNPNPMTSRAQFVENFLAYYLMAGNSYVEAVRPTPNAPPLELWNVRPDRMSIVVGSHGYPAAYKYKDQGNEKIWVVDAIKLTSDILHMKTFNPTNLWYGMAPLEAAMLSLDQNNAIGRWNLALLQNSGIPSGVLQMATSDGNPSGTMTAEQYGRVKAEFDQWHGGPRNAGRPLLLEGGLKWTQTSLSAKDMDFTKNKEVSGMDIGNIFGVPLELLGMGQKTFSNYEEARYALYEDTILPLMDRAEGDINRWLGPAFGDQYMLCYDKDDIEALSFKRDKKYTSLSTVTFLTQNEKREAVGYEPVDGWDVFIIGNQAVDQPDELISGGSFGQPNDPAAQDDGTDPAGKKPVKKPKPAADDNIDDGADDTEKATPHEAGESEWKSFNLLNKNEKQQSARKQNARKDALEKPFFRDLKKEFDDLAVTLGKTATDVTEPKALEFALVHVIDAAMPSMAKTISRHIEYTCEDFGLAVLSHAKSIGYGFEVKAKRGQFESFVKDYVKRRTATAISQIEGSTRKQIQRIVKRIIADALAEGDGHRAIAKQLQEEFEGMSSGRARTIARTETQFASQNSSLAAAKSLQIPGMKKEWVATVDDRTRDGYHGGPDHVEANGQVVDIDDKFHVNPDTEMECPGDPSGPADQVINCRCSQVYTVADRD